MSDEQERIVDRDGMFGPRGWIPRELGVGEGSPEDYEHYLAVYEIDRVGRYVVAVTYTDDRIGEQEAKERMAALHVGLEAWWQSGEKFLVLGSTPGAEILLMRVDEGNGDDD